MDTTKKLPTVLSLCTGYGGIERGLDLAGVEHRVIAHVEIEAFAIANLVAKMEAGKLDAAPVWSNLKTLPVEPFRDRVDLITGGYPCQPFSAAGKRLGEEDPRHLWPYIKKIIAYVKPARCFFENVEGHISLGLREVISDLESLGYKTAWGIFSAREVGAHHQRKRVYILAHSDSSWELQSKGNEQNEWGRISDRGKDLADSEGEHARDVGKNIWAPSGEINPFIDSGGFGRGHDRQENRKTLADPEDFGLQRPSEARDTFTKRTQPDDQQPYGCDSTYIGSWPPEPGLGRVVDGCADRVDRIRLLGNGVVPKTAAKAWFVLSEDLCS